MTMTHVLSILAIIVSSFGLYQSYENNRLSKQPHLDFEVKIKKQGEADGIYLENNGIGPAILTKITYELDTNRISSLHKMAKRIIHELQNPKCKINYTDYSVGEYIANNNTATKLLSLGGRCNNVNVRELLCQRISIQYEYQSIFKKSKKIAKKQC